ncbi:hypothetical protein V5O48_008980 [Marasmius crinis-equi]|uniref:Uncharacterized protein n=1 Tax=Marasmius crinis-equi TaxID=585013 RepID=A0ABR3FCH2_9AGAR
MPITDLSYKAACWIGLVGEGLQRLGSTADLPSASSPFDTISKILRYRLFISVFATPLLLSAAFCALIIARNNGLENQGSESFVETVKYIGSLIYSPYNAVTFNLYSKIRPPLVYFPQVRQSKPYWNVSPLKAPEVEEIRKADRTQDQKLFQLA